MIVLPRTKSKFDFPLHNHEEFELNFIENAKGAKRIVGDHIDEIDELELVLVESNLEHGWFTHKCKSEVIKEVTIQFHRDLFDEKFLHRNQMSFIRNMFEISLRGISFSNDTIRSIAPRIINLKQKQGFESVLELMSILHSLSISDNIKTLSNSSFNNIETVSYNSRRIERIMVYLNNYFNKEVSLSEAAKLIGMTDISLS